MPVVDDDLAARDPLWSPDGSKIAYERLSIDGDDVIVLSEIDYARTNDDATRAVIVVVDLKTNTERVVDATSVVRKQGARFWTSTGNQAHLWSCGIVVGA